jgi:hypothetical protein
MRKILALVTLMLASIVCLAQGNRLMFTGNVDRIQYNTVQVFNPDPAGTPLTIPVIGVEYHYLDPAPGFYPVDLKIFLPILTDDPRGIENCVEWFGKTQEHELALNTNRQPGQWDPLKSPWPYLQVNFNPRVTQVQTWVVNPDGTQGAEIWLWKNTDVQCQQIADNLCPYDTSDSDQTQDAVLTKHDEIEKLMAHWHMIVRWNRTYAPYRVVAK